MKELGHIERAWKILFPFLSQMESEEAGDPDAWLKKGRPWQVSLRNHRFLAVSLPPWIRRTSFPQFTVNSTQPAFPKYPPAKCHALCQAVQIWPRLHPCSGVAHSLRAALAYGDSSQALEVTLVLPSDMERVGRGHRNLAQRHC